LFLGRGFRRHAGIRVASCNERRDEQARWLASWAKTPHPELEPFITDDCFFGGIVNPPWGWKQNVQLTRGDVVDDEKPRRVSLNP
jgi:hypothetical protein